MSKFLKILAPAAGGTASVLTLAYVLVDQFVVDIPAPARGIVAISPASAQTVETPAAASAEDGFGLGRPALDPEIVAWDIDIRPDGMGLPVGSGDVFTGEEIFIEKCAVCHGDFGEGAGRWPVLAGGDGTLAGEDPNKTIGSYWPYLSTVYDYVNRAMPFGEAQSLSPDEVYAITAYLLNLNYIVEDDFVLSNETFADVAMPNESNFFLDDRAEVELPRFSGEVCMSDCKNEVEIVMRAAVLDVTPETDEGDAPTEEMAASAPDSGDADVEMVAVSTDPAMIEAGEGVFRACKACHAVGEGAANKSGPQLNELVGRPIGGIEGFRYSTVFQDAHEAGEVWTVEALTAFLANPREAMPGTKMSYRGLRDDADIEALLAYLTATGG